MINILLNTLLDKTNYDNKTSKFKFNKNKPEIKRTKVNNINKYFIFNEY